MLQIRLGEKDWSSWEHLQHKEGQQTNLPEVTFRFALLSTIDIQLYHHFIVIIITIIITIFSILEKNQSTMQFLLQTNW